MHGGAVLQHINVCNALKYSELLETMQHLSSIDRHTTYFLSKYDTHAVFDDEHVPVQYIITHVYI